MSADAHPDNLLFEWYGRYIGDPETETDVYLGFALFFGGVALGSVGILVFLLAAVLYGEQSVIFAIREVAMVAAAGGFPLLLLGIVVLLPADRRMVLAALVGMAVCVLALALFVYAYPWHWNVDSTPDYSAQGVAVYAVGLVALVGSTAASLVGHQVERASGGPAVTAAADDDAETVSDEQVRRDIDDAMADAEISWGGVRKRETKRLELDTGDIDDVAGNVDASTAKTKRASARDVDDAVSGLMGLKGGNKETASGGGTDEQAAALAELRERKRAEELATSPGAVEQVREHGLVEGVRRYVTRR